MTYELKLAKEEKRKKEEESRRMGIDLKAKEEIRIEKEKINEDEDNIALITKKKFHK